MIIDILVSDCCDNYMCHRCAQSFKHFSKRGGDLALKCPLCNDTQNFCLFDVNKSLPVSLPHFPNNPFRSNATSPPNLPKKILSTTPINKPPLPQTLTPPTPHPVQNPPLIDFKPLHYSFEYSSSLLLS